MEAIILFLVVILVFVFATTINLGYKMNEAEKKREEFDQFWKNVNSRTAVAEVSERTRKRTAYKEHRSPSKSGDASMHASSGDSSSGFGGD